MALQELLMPKLGHLQEVGKVIEWVKKPGDLVRKGEILMVVETEKTSVEVEASFNGRLLYTLIGTDEEVPVNTPIAEYESDDDGEGF